MANKKLERLTFNIGGKVALRYETLEGKSYLVCPMIMAVEGVLPGSNGPLLYTRNEMEKAWASWNHKPMALFHPEKDGEPVSGCTPEMIEKQKCGLVLNTEMDDHPVSGLARWKSEAWFDIQKTNRLDPDLIPTLESGKQISVSTGLFTVNKETNGVFGGVRYDGEACDYQPDHLAVLPGMQGACSLQDGAGLLINQKGWSKETVLAANSRTPGAKDKKKRKSKSEFEKASEERLVGLKKRERERLAHDRDTKRRLQLLKKPTTNTWSQQAREAAARKRKARGRSEGAPIDKAAAHLLKRFRKMTDQELFEHVDAMGKNSKYLFASDRAMLKREFRRRGLGSGTESQRRQQGRSWRVRDGKITNK